MNTFKENLRDLKKAKQLTQKELTKEVNVSEDCIYTWEKGKAEPSIKQIIELAHFFECTTDELLGAEEKPIGRNQNINQTFNFKF